MNAHHQLFGLFVPGTSWLHRLPVGAKFALMLVVSIVPLIVRELWLSAALLAVAAVLLTTTRIHWRRCLVLAPMIWVLAACLVAYQLIWGTWQIGLMLVANLVLCVYAARILTLTTPATALLDALVVAARPVRLVGGSPERVGLAAALMIRSIPFLFGSFSDVRAAARARGLERNLLAQLTPVVVGAVAYARATGEALAARGLGEDD
ncbi:energy-coupling factor transporter transmembrane component T family protein [Granulicoccus sp. GXG6511]|uniref:energy-coupling factor transporter transmembrane component T family protein n=1 Tax=Granulicoccus sp. GXG6511 TaxID=3381351 RepID=UPI003D7DE468